MLLMLSVPIRVHPWPRQVFMIITLNGEKKEIPGGLTVRGLLELLEIKPERVAVEINEEIVRKASYDATAVRESDRVEVVQFMGGGS